MAQTSFEIARKAMIDSQIRPNKVIDERVIAAFAQTPREEFVPKSLRDVAYVDEDLTLSGGRYIVEAMVMGRLWSSTGNISTSPAVHTRQKEGGKATAPVAATSLGLCVVCAGGWLGACFSWSLAFSV